MEAWRPRPGPSQDEAGGVASASSLFIMAVKRASAFFAFVLCAGALISAPLELKVVGDRVNLRARPVFDAEVVGQVSSGDSLIAPEGIPEGAEWVKVRPPQNVDLWIFSALVADGVVAADDSYVRCGPGQQYKPVGKLGKGFKIEPRGVAVGDWLRIAPVPTAELYISSAYVLAVPSVTAESEGTGNRKQGTGNRKQETEVQVSEKNSSPSPETPKPVPPKTEGTPQQTNCPTNQLPNKPTVQQTNERPSNRPTVKPSNEMTAVPAVISGYQLASGVRQGEVVTLRGRLERLSLAKAPTFTRYQLVDKAGSSRSAAICSIIGLQGQWYELAGSEIEIEGQLWTLWNSIPVIDASRVRRIASWEK